MVRYTRLHPVCGCIILLRKYNLELYMTATELTESTERGVRGGKSISVFSVLSVAESYKKQIRFSIHGSIYILCTFNR